MKDSAEVTEGRAEVTEGRAENEREERDGREILFYYVDILF